MRKGILDDGQLSRRREAWVDAARRTPHGKPIELNPEH
jgi:hypothetical protein